MVEHDGVKVTLDAPADFRTKYPRQTMVGYEEESDYVVLARDKINGIHWAVRFFSLLNTETGELMFGGKIRRAYDDYYLQRESTSKKLEAMSEDELKFRATSLIESTKIQIPWQEVNPVRAKFQVGEDVQAMTSQDAAKSFLENFEKLCHETIENKMLVFCAIKDMAEYQRKEVGA